MMIIISISSSIITIVMVMVKMVLMKMIGMDGEKKGRVMMSQLEDDSGSQRVARWLKLSNQKTHAVTMFCSGSIDQL